MIDRRLWSVGFGATLAGLIWALIPGSGGDPRVEELAGVDRVLSSRKVRAVHRDERDVFEKMEVIRSFADRGFEEVAGGLKHWENGQLKGAYMAFPDRAALARMGQIDPKKAWLWIDEHQAGSLDETITKERKEMIEQEWAFQDYEGLVSFLRSRNPEKSVTELVSLKALELGPPERWVRLYQERQKGQFSICLESPFVSSLKNGGRCRDVLKAWRNSLPEVEQYWEKRFAEARNPQQRSNLEKSINPGLNALVQKTIQRWREVDEAGFLASEFVEWETK